MSLMPNENLRLRSDYPDHFKPIGDGVAQALQDYALVHRLTMENISLIQQLAEKDAVISRLQFALADTEALEIGTAERLAASQLREQQLREALKTAGMNCVDDFIAAGTLQLADSKSDASALEALIAKAGEVMRERCAKFCDETESQYFDGYESRNVLPSDLCEDLRSLPSVTLEDLK